MTGGGLIINRSQAAASIQIRGLEDLLGTPVFKRHGHGVVLNTAGERLSHVARQVIQMLDAALTEFTGGGLEGTLRIGIPVDQSKGALTKIIAVFMHDHPKVNVKMRCASSSRLSSALVAGELDSAIREVERVGPNMELLREEPMHWAVSRDHRVLDHYPIPVALIDPECWWQGTALRALEAIGRAHRVVVSSESVTDISAAVEAGMAIGVLNQSALKPCMESLSHAESLGEMPTSKLVLEYGTSADNAVCRAIADAIKRAFVASDV